MSNDFETLPCQVENVWIWSFASCIDIISYFLHQLTQDWFSEQKKTWGRRQDLGGVFQEGGKVDGDLVLALETLLLGEAELDPHPHHHGVVVSFGNLQTEASRFGVGNEQATSL